MSQKQSNLLCLRDLLEHLRSCQDQLDWAEESPVAGLLIETMLRDLEKCRQICDGLHRRVRTVRVA